LLYDDMMVVEEEKRILEDTGNTTYIMRPSEGAM
jgi:hypothetical protein